MGKKIQCIGRYGMQGVALGKGNFARVELAQHNITEVKVAIKVIDTRKIKEDYVRQNLHREAKIMSQLRHPNIVRLYETLKANTLYCLVLEYAAGGDLLTYVKSQKEGHLTESCARPFMRQMISALQYLHERNVVHRDLKMENIMLDEKQKNVKLIDFGLSNVYSPEEPLKTHCGSPEYAAPELFTVGRAYGPEIDIWSLGIIMYAVILGRMPFSTAMKDEYHRQKLLQAIQRGLSSHHDIEMQACSTDCRNLLRQLIEPKPELRLPLHEIQRHPWVTRNGRTVFYTYRPLPKNMHMRQQTIAELSIMMGLKRKEVAETVKESKADELSAMFNMILDRKRRDQGAFDFDHTRRPFGNKGRSRSGSRERAVPAVRPSRLRGLTKSSKALSRSRAGSGERASHMAPPEITAQSASDQEDSVCSGASSGRAVPAASNQLLAPPPRTSSLSSSTASPHVPIKQRRPRAPPTLNLTLDLSRPDSPTTKINPTTRVAIPSPRRLSTLSQMRQNLQESNYQKPTRPSSLPWKGLTDKSKPAKFHYGVYGNYTNYYYVDPTGYRIAPKATPEKTPSSLASSSSTSCPEVEILRKTSVVKFAADVKILHGDNVRETTSDVTLSTRIIPETTALTKSLSEPPLAELREDCLFPLTQSFATTSEESGTEGNLCRFSHTGAHALDVFVSPDEPQSPTGPLWRPVAAGLSPTLLPDTSIVPDYSDDEEVDNLLSNRPCKNKVRRRLKTNDSDTLDSEKPVANVSSAKVHPLALFGKLPVLALLPGTTTGSGQSSDEGRASPKLIHEQKTRRKTGRWRHGIAQLLKRHMHAAAPSISNDIRNKQSNGGTKASLNAVVTNSVVRTPPKTLQISTKCNSLSVQPPSPPSSCPSPVVLTPCSSPTGRLAGPSRRSDLSSDDGGQAAC